MGGDGRTHWEACWQEPGHSACALALVRELTGRIAMQSVALAHAQSDVELLDAEVARLTRERDEARNGIEPEEDS